MSFQIKTLIIDNITFKDKNYLKIEIEYITIIINKERPSNGMRRNKGKDRK